MFSTKEIRWFSRREEKAIINWFNGHGYSFGSIEGRRDHYLPYLKDNGIGFKLREGNVELKHRTGKPDKVKISSLAEGFMERYTKWSFNISEEDELSKKIINYNDYKWIKVQKERMGIKVQGSENGNIHWVNLDDQIPYGCQIEYTRVTVHGQSWFTFGLEWFGEVEIELHPDFLDQLLGTASLKAEYSMGYAEFLNKVVSESR